MPQKPTDEIDLSDIEDDSEIDLSDIEDVKLDDIEDAPVAVAPPVVQPPVVQEPEQSWYGKAWNKISEPLTDAPSRFAKTIADYVDDPNDEYSHPLASFGAGAIQGAGDVASGFTSPVNIAATLAGVKGLGYLAKGARAIGGLASGGSMAHGVGETFGSNKTIPERLWGVAEMAGGALGIHQAATYKFQPKTPVKTPEPVVDPALAETVKKNAAQVAEAQALITKKMGPNKTEGMTDGEIVERANTIKATEPVIEPIRKKIPSKVKDGPISAIYKGMQETGLGDSIPQYDIINGPSHGSTVGTETLKKMGIEVPKSPEVANELPIVEAANAQRPRVLPQELRGAKPRYQNYEPKFVSDIDKALFIIAQDTPSKANSAYLDFAMKATGLDEAGAIAAGKTVRAKMKTLLKGQEAGEVLIPRQHIPESESVAPPIVPPVKPPVIAADAQLPKAPRRKVSVQMNGTAVDKITGEPVDLRTVRDIEVAPTDKIGPDETVKIPDEILELEKTPKKKRDEHAVARAMNFFRAVKTSFDASFPFRQGLGQIHTAGWRNSWNGMIKSIGSENAYKVVQESVENHPMYKQAMEDGLALPDMTERMEEMHHSTSAENLPILGRAIKSSGRAYNAFALKMRIDNYAAMINNLERLSDIARNKGSARTGMFAANTRFGDFGVNTKYSPLDMGAWEKNRQGMSRVQKFFDPDSVDSIDPRKNQVLRKQVAEMINVTSGRGNLGWGEKIIGELNVAVFSPRFVKSRIDMLNPARYMMASAPVRKEYAKSALAMAAFWISTTQLARQLPDTEVNNDPDSSDFGKIKIGNTRFDPPAGLQQYIVLMHRIASGERTKVDGKTVQMGRGIQGWPTAVAEFGLNKLAPVPSVAKKYLFRNGKQPFEVGEELIRLMMPMPVETFFEIIQEEPWLLPGILPAATMGASSVGIGTQTFGGKKGDPKVFGGYFPPEKNAFGQGYPSRDTEIKLTGKDWFQ